MHKHLVITRSRSCFFSGRQNPRRVIRARLCLRLVAAKEKAVVVFHAADGRFF
jgi:hypothetical protein